MIDAEIKGQVISSLERSKSGQLTFLSALIAAGGEITVAVRELQLEYLTSSTELALEFCRIVKDNYNFAAEISLIQPEDKRCGKYFKILLPNKTAKMLLEDTKMLVTDEYGAVKTINFGVNPLAKRDDKHFAEYIKGLFRASGKVFIYEGNYIAELLLPNREFAEETSDMLAKYDITGGLYQRNEKTAFVLKAGGNVANLLTLVGAADTSLALIDKLVLREVSNRINRQANCEAANSDKTALAAVRQILAIKRIKELHREDKLSEELREVAELRVANPDMPLAKIAEKLRLSKSGVTHRFNKIINIAEELANNTKEDKK
jgi:DNA-binding protein WhiA